MLKALNRSVAFSAGGALVITLLSGCASIIDGDSQVVRVISTGTDSALCTGRDENGKEFSIGSTPASIELERSLAPFDVTCRKEGYKEGSAFVDSEFNSTSLINLGFGAGLIIGFGIDLATGAIQDLPSTILVPMHSDGMASRNSGSESSATEPDAVVFSPEAGPQARPSEDPFASHSETDGSMGDSQDEVSMQLSQQKESRTRNTAGDSFGSENSGSDLPPTSHSGDVWSGATMSAQADRGRADNRSQSTSSTDGFVMPPPLSEPSEQAFVPPPAVEPMETMSSETRPTTGTPSGMSSADRSSLFPSSKTIAPAVSAPRAAPVRGRYSIQVGAFAVAANAQQAADLLGSLGRSATVTREGRLNLVRFGEFASRAEARTALREFKESSGRDGIVVKQ